ncbi:unnamed protein product [Trichobilharzia regenti]|nr:unnamed protein product [Trichobilharzia regenti]
MAISVELLASDDNITIQSLDVDYVLVIFGGYIGYSGDDINKFLWMVRIGGGEHPNEIREQDFLTSNVSCLFVIIIIIPNYCFLSHFPLASGSFIYTVSL